MIITAMAAMVIVVMVTTVVVVVSAVGVEMVAAITTNRFRQLPFVCVMFTIRFCAKDTPLFKRCKSRQL